MTRRLLSSAVLAASLCALVPGAAMAGSQSVGNSCLYSYDSYWRDMPVTLTGTPNKTTAAPGETVRLAGQTLDVTLPDWLAEYGYNLGLLQPGENQLPTEIWVAIRGTNTTQGVQWQQVDTVAKTTITTTSTGSFQDATPFVYDVPHLTDTDWTAKGGPIAFSQARSGSLPAIPVGPGGANRTPKGSVFLNVDISGYKLGLDCASGGFIAQGANYSEHIAPPFATVDVPAFSCINPLTPAGTTTSPIDVDLLPDTADPKTIQPGGTFTTRPRVMYRIPSAYLQALAAAGRLQTGDNEITGTLSVAVRAVGATPAAQTATVLIDPVTVTVTGGAVTSGDVVGTATLSVTTWTASGTAGVQLSAGPVGSLGSVALGGGTNATAYGSAYARLTVTPETTPATRLSLDCVSGTAVIGNTGIAYGERGNIAAAEGGDQARYDIAANQLDPFAVIPVEGVVVEKPPTVDPPIQNPGGGGGTPTPVVTPGPGGSGGPGTTVLPTPLLSITATSLQASKSKLSVAVICSTGTCRGTLKLRTAAKVKLTKKSKAKQVTLTGAARYTVGAGRGTVKLTLGRDGRALLRRSSKLSVQIVATPSSGKPVTKKVTLKR
ncbi:MAG: hypothetical protein JHC95_08120 [Solirubrobacteraceae bacterium]|nr:hypothetical protein [Solirubrobacteraceae bacterium]